MWTDFDREVMAQALLEARRGRTSPNPRVGAAVVLDGELVALGYHERAGAAHAEVDAIGKAGDSVRGATLYVTLEPCNHHGRTGPCTEAIIEAGIGRVVIGSVDPAPHVPGAMARLRAAGIEVSAGLLEEECDALIADFAKHIRTGLPFVTLKAAVTLDGKIATRTGDSKWITGEAARKHVHQLRADHDAILLGVGTVLADDPRLDVRHVSGPDPIRVVLDADLRTPVTARLVRSESDAPTWIFHAKDADSERAAALAEAGAELIAVQRDERGIDLRAVLHILGQRDIVRVLVEGGAHVHGSFLDLQLADRAAIFIAPRFIGDERAVSMAAGLGAESVQGATRLLRARMTAVGEDWLVEGEFQRRAGDVHGTG
jgi:diaminohydroxyphosphoribosylaminopyrimidine deaminase/5-amino-6-(5-phosphoribosylamino)uracil reductase